MSESNYKTLGLDETSSFEEVQVARTRLLAECEDDVKRKEAIEAAYDAILMERLRMRQEGKIKVPDRIRFAEKASTSSPAAPKSPISMPPPTWLQDWLDSPSREDILWPSAIFLGLAVLNWFSADGGGAPTILGLAVAASVYFLNRKEKKFWRSLGLTAAALVVGVLLGSTMVSLIGQQTLGATSPTAVIGTVAMALLWFISSFLR